MTAQITGFVSRSEAGLRSPRSVSRNITPARGGVSEHYGGGAQSAADPNADHERCVATWVSWQNYHMNRHKWVDIAYTGGFCNHGYAFAGRGVGVRTAANGTNHGNQNYYAIVWIGGAGQTPTQAAFDAADWWISKLRSANAGNGVKPHNFFKATGCPGKPLEQHAASRDGETDFVDSEPSPTPSEPSPSRTSNHVKRIQRSLEVTSDGKWGPNTDSRALQMRIASRAKRGWPDHIHKSFDIREVQSVVDTKVDGIWGPLSQAALVRWVKEFQDVMNVKSDSWWGPKTDGKFLALRRRYLNKY